MQKSKYEDRAKAIHGAKYKEQTIPEGIDKKTYWKDHVRSKEDAEKYFELFYPMLPKQAQQAYADYFDRAVRGEFALPDHYLKNAHSETTYRWDYESEVKEEMLQGKINITRKRLEALMDEEEDKENRVK